MARYRIERVLVCSNAAVLRTHHALQRTEAPSTSLGTVHSGKTLTHVSNLSAAKGLHHVLAAFRELASLFPEIRLILAGPCSSRRDRQAILDLSAEFPGRVTFFGPATPAEISRILAKSHLFLFPSQYRHEAEPMVIAEAIAAGVRVIATERGCMAEQVGINGRIIQEPESLAEAVRAELLTPTPFLREVAPTLDPLLQLLTKRAGDMTDV